MSQSRKQKVREELAKQHRRRQRIALTTGGAAVVMIAVIVALILTQKPPPAPPPGLGNPISQATYNQLSGVSDNTLSSSLNTPGISPIVSATGGSPLTSDPNKPEFLYIGAEFCPFCAAERWSMIVALTKFGSFPVGNGGLTYMLSSDTDIYPNTPTFSFHGATYTSPYLSFVSVETSDRAQKPLETATTQQQADMVAFDSAQNIPFIDISTSSNVHYLINGQSGHSGSQFPPTNLRTNPQDQSSAPLNWTQVGAQLNDPSTQVGRSIAGAADTIISAICHADGGNPASVCSNSYAKIPEAPFSTAQAKPLDSAAIIAMPASLKVSRFWNDST